MSHTAFLTPGTLLQGRYQIGRVVGYGGMGAVYEVVDQRLDARVALKQIVRDTEVLRAAFEREARLLANLKHPALPKVSDYFTEGDAAFLVMDFIDGPSVDELIGLQGALPLARVLAWADALLDVLEYLHNRLPPVIHRDIKPQNIKIGPDDKPVLLDFGIAKGSAGISRSSSASDTPSVSAFTRSYAPVEQLLGQPTTAQSDLFALGATLYHMLTGRLQVGAGDRQSAVIAGHPDPLQPAHVVNGRVPPAVGALIQRMLGLREADRPATASQVREELRVARSGQARPAAPAPTEPGDDSPPARPQPAPAKATRQPARAASSGEAAISPRSLQARIHAQVRRVLDGYHGAWMVWCDPHDEWRPLLERVAGDTRQGGFRLVPVAAQTAGEIGGIEARQQIQQLIDAGESFVLLVATGPDHLGWLWAQALLAEETYDTPLRKQLLAWGWQPQRAHVPDEELAALARQGLAQDPAEWGGGSLQPDLPLLLEVLAGGAMPEPDQTYTLDVTVQQAGLPPFDPAAAERWRLRALAQLLVTQADHAAPGRIGAGNELLIAETARATALDLLERWVDSLRLSRGLADAILEADKIAALSGQLRDIGLEDGPFLSRAAEQSLFAATCTRLARHTGQTLLEELAGLRPKLVPHVAGFWGDQPANADPSRIALALPWGELQRLSEAAQTFLDAVPVQEWSTPEQALRWYTGGGWRLDSAGEAFLRDLSRSTPELLALIGPLRDAYRAGWEPTLVRWSDVWTAAGCPTPDLLTAGEWLKRTMDRPGPTAVLMIDALRYDLGAHLVAQLNEQEGTQRAVVRPSRAPLPSITALGMGMALPVAEGDLRAEISEGRWRLIDTRTQLDLSIAEKRRQWLRQRGIVAEDGVLALADLLRGQVPQPGKGRQVLVISDDLIDQLGHDDELELLGSNLAIERYRNAIGLLRDAGWRRVLVVTDHGYIHWAGSDQRPQPLPAPGPAYRSRRALAYPVSAGLAAPLVLAPGGGWQVLPARGAASWSAYGKLGYFHGGASLQEWIIPCIQIEWPSHAQPVGVSMQKVPRILSAQPRMLLRAEYQSMFAEDVLPRDVEVLIRDAASRVILFRSPHLRITPRDEPLPVVLKQVEGVVAPRDTPLQIEVRDTQTEAVIDAMDSLLAIDLDDW
ncbi:MAG: hypothetical protein OHK0022_49430 [Roseiflexaceae bacterium]